MLRAAVSLWSADLSNLGSEIERIDPFCDRYHIDVCDGRYAPSLLFFPDLVAAIRPRTKRPFEVHLIVEEPERWVDPFAESGADSLIVYPDAPRDLSGLIDVVIGMNLGVGVSLGLEHPVSAIETVLDQLDLVCVIGTASGIKGVKEPAPEAYEKIRELKRLRDELGLDFEIEADGAIRRETVPKLREAGADLIVPGSLMFQNDPAEIHSWLATL